MQVRYGGTSARQQAVDDRARIATLERALVARDEECRRLRRVARDLGDQLARAACKGENPQTAQLLTRLSTENAELRAQVQALGGVAASPDAGTPAAAASTPAPSPFPVRDIEITRLAANVFAVPPSGAPPPPACARGAFEHEGGGGKSPPPHAAEMASPPTPASFFGHAGGGVLPVRESLGCAGGYQHPQRHRVGGSPAGGVEMSVVAVPDDDEHGGSLPRGGPPPHKSSGARYDELALFELYLQEGDIDAYASAPTQTGAGAAEGRGAREQARVQGGQGGAIWDAPPGRRPPSQLPSPPQRQPPREKVFAVESPVLAECPAGMECRAPTCTLRHVE